MDFLMENLRPFGTLLGYAIIWAVEAPNRLWTLMALILITLFGLWGLRRIKVFHFGFLWWGKHAHVRIMLQSFYSSSASNHTAAGKNNNLSLCRNMCIDDFHVFTYTGETMRESGIYTRRSKKRSKSSSMVDSLTLCNSVEDMDNCTEARSACFLQTKMMFIIEKSSSLSVSRSVSSPLRFREKGLESRSSDQQLDYHPRSLIALPKHDKLCPVDKFEKNEGRSIEEIMQESRGKITFSSDFLYDLECEEKYKGGLFFMNDGEEERHLGPCLLDNCVNLGMWRRLVSFEIQFGWDRLQSLRLGYGSSWNFCTGGSRLDWEIFSKYLVRENHVGKVLASQERSAVKLFSVQEVAVSSIDMACNMDLSSTSTLDNTVRVWDLEVGKCVNKMMVNDYEIVGSHIENSRGFLLNSIMIREGNASLFVWDRRDFLNPFNFCVGNMSTFHCIRFNDNKVCVSDCLNDRLFDLRMIAGSSPDCGIR